jgi:hypothetical protein
MRFEAFCVIYRSYCLYEVDHGYLMGLRAHTDRFRDVLEELENTMKARRIEFLYLYFRELERKYLH